MGIKLDEQGPYVVDDYERALRHLRDVQFLIDGLAQKGDRRALRELAVRLNQLAFRAYPLGPAHWPGR
jgi:hypothetical protein